MSILDDTVVATTNRELSEAIATVVEARCTDSRAPTPLTRDLPIELALRRGLVEDKAHDPNGFERIIGRSDLLAINFLDRGRRSADAVCRIKLPMDSGHSYGTGFLVGPRLLLTNNHVLQNATEASRAEAEFSYEHDLDGVLRTPVQFNLAPHELFFTSAEADFTLVAVSPMAENGVPLDRYGWLPLIPMRGKTVDGEWVTIIQHPGGQPKQIAIHSSQIIKLDPAIVTVPNLDLFVHYSTDTEPGSSGAPVLNDQWQVVALHHKGVPAPRRPGEPTRWVGNEGVRVSTIFRFLERSRIEDPDAGRALDLIGRGMGFPPLPLPSVPAAATTPEAEERFAPLKEEHWQREGLGYDPNFLSLEIPLTPIYQPMIDREEVAPLLAGDGHELRYFHFSSVLHKDRRFPLLTAVNIDGRRVHHPGERKDTWRRDSRIAGDYQPDDSFYRRGKKDPLEKVYFSRGHLVRLLDPCWSEAADEEGQTADARRGMEDSFHFTNAAPQVQTYNDSDWGDLEDYLLDKAQTSERRLTVFTGPIFREDDPLYGRERPGGPWQIPLSFWKVAVLQKTKDRIAAAAFIVGQTEYVQALYEAKVFSGLKPYTIDEMRDRKIQTTIAAIEEETGLDFSALRNCDVQGSLESTRQTHWFRRLEDVTI